MEHRFRTAIMIGATGMLAGALKWVAGQAEHTIAVSRRATQRVERLGLPRTTALTADWRRGDGFVRSITEAVDPDQVDCLLIWMHSDGAAALQALLDRFLRRPCLIVHVLSSSSGDPASYREAVDTQAGGDVRCRYCTVKLGAIIGDTGWRWLTDTEISDGAIEAARTGQDVIVGQIPQ